MKVKGTLALVAMALFTLPALAADKPTTAEVKKVMDYYRDGSDAILVDSMLCEEIEKSGENKNECAKPLGNGPVPLHKNGYMWMNFLVPGNDKVNLLVQFKYKNRALDSDEIKLSNAIRYRTWKRLQTSKSGDWVVTIEQETENGYTPVATLNYTVAEEAETKAE